MEELTIQESMEKFPYLQSMTEYTYFTTRSDIEFMRKGEKITVNNEEIPIEYIKRILENDFYYDYAYRYLNGDINNFSVSFIIGGDTAGTISYRRITLLKAIKLLIESNKIEITDEEKIRYETLKNLISYDNVEKKYNNNYYNLNIDGIEYSIPFEKIISIMHMPQEEFNDLCSNDDIKEIMGIKKEHIVYAAFKFFKENKIFKNYIIPNKVQERYKEIGMLQKIDLQSLNKHLSTRDIKYQKIQINPELKNAIIKDMPNELTEIEKAIYIYIKMCKLLTYDEEYFAVNQHGPATNKHKSTEHVSNINLENNKVVCFEFNLIYSKLLNELGINFSSDYKGMVGEAYGEAHANLEFRYNKFLVNADSVTSILHGDIMQAKLNQPLEGIKCINKNQKTQEEFKNMITKVYKLIATQEKSIDNQPVEHIQTLEELLEEYSKNTDNIKDIDINERLSILVDKVNSKKMTGIDSLSYILQLRKILFTSEQRKNNIEITIIRNNEKTNDDTIAMATAIFVLNNSNYSENQQQNIYYFYNPNNQLVPVTFEELQRKFNEEIFEYIDKDDPRIPGIIEKGGKKL